MGFQDTRTQAELLLAPRKPLARTVASLGSLKLNLGGAALPGVISDPSQLAGPVRNTLATAINQKALVESLSTGVSKVLSGFDSQHKQLENGSFVAPDPKLLATANGVPDVSSFFSFSTLAVGQKIPASFNAIIEQRKKQLQQLVRSFSSVFSTSSFKGVSVTENFNPKPNPQADEIDVPDVPRLAQGGKVAQAESILKDKIRFAVHGVTIGSGRPNFWSRLLSAAAVATVPTLNPTVNQIFKDRTNQSTWSEPVTPYAAQFPYNKVQQTESGHVIELDDSPGAERVHIFHRSGSFVEFHPDGSVVYKTMKHGYRVTMGDDHVKVSGACHVAIDGDSTLYVKGNVQMQTDGDFNVQTKGDYNVYAKNINLRAKKTFKADGTKLDLRYITLPGIPGFVSPMGGGPFFTPRLNIAAVAADFPDNNLQTVASNHSMIPGLTHPGTTLGATSTDAPPAENPLSNWSIYTAITPAAIAYRSHLFDTPEEVQDVEMFSGHTSLQQNLGDTTTNNRKLGGKLKTVDSGLVEPASKPTIDYLNFDNFKGKYEYANGYVLGGTSFTLADVADLALHPDIVQDTLTAPSIEGVPSDGTEGGNFRGGADDSTDRGHGGGDGNRQD